MLNINIFVPVSSHGHVTVLFQLSDPSKGG